MPIVTKSEPTSDPSLPSERLEELYDEQRNARHTAIEAQRNLLSAIARCGQAYEDLKVIREKICKYSSIQQVNLQDAFSALIEDMTS